MKKSFLAVFAVLMIAALVLGACAQPTAPPPRLLPLSPLRLLLPNPQSSRRRTHQGSRR